MTLPLLLITGAACHQQIQYFPAAYLKEHQVQFCRYPGHPAVVFVTWVALICQPVHADNYLQVEAGIELFYQDTGPNNDSNATMILVPGWTFSTEVFSQQISHFSKTRRVIALDPRSQGRSTLTVAGNDYITHASDLAKLIDALALDNFVLVGWSFGCLDTWGYIKLAGIGKVRAHVCIDLPPKPLSIDTDDWVEGPLDDVAAAYHTYLRTPQGQREFVRWYADEVMIQREISAEEMSWIVQQSLRSPPFVAAALFASGNFSNHLPEAKRLDESRPSLFVVAEHWSGTAVPYLNAQLPKSTVKVLGGHMMFWEFAQEFNRIVDDFLGAASIK
ncbi:MAG: alpha/beta fold hydrolase [Gammaproteobacteria bacterium]